MKKLKSIAILALALCMIMTNIGFAGEKVRSSVTSERVELKYPLIYYKVAKRIYDNYQKGIETTEIGIEGVELPVVKVRFNFTKDIDVKRFIINDILNGLELWAQTEIKGSDNIIKIKAEADITQGYKNSKELERELDSLIKKANKKSSIKSKLGYINDKVGKETKYSKSTENTGQTAEDVLVEGKGLCAGFANTVSEVCKKLGVKVVEVPATNHVANLVYINNEWKIWDLTWNQGTNGDVETVYWGEPGKDGEIEYEMGPKNRQYFLLDLDSTRGEKYIEASGMTKEHLGTTEALISIKYPEMGNLDLELGDIEVDISNIEFEEEQKENSGKGTTGNYVPDIKIERDPVEYPDDYGQNKIVLDGQGNIVCDNMTEEPVYKKEEKAQKQDVNPSKKVKAKPTNSNVMVDGKKVEFEAYNINGNNYFKLRDIAMVLNGTDKQFVVGWDGENNTIRLFPGGQYTPVGGELETTRNKDIKEGALSTSKVSMGGKQLGLTAFNINNNNYFKLRDIGKELNFGVSWDNANKTIKIDSSVGYTE